MKHWRRVSLALIASLLVHFFSIADVQWTWPWLGSEDDQVLDQSKAQSVKRVRLITQAQRPVSEWPTLYWVRPEPPAPPLPVAAKPIKAQQAAADIDADTIVTSTPVEMIEPPPSFPVQITAVHRANYYGFSLKLTQQWFMEGFRYFIRDDASKFGFTASITSEGRISDEGLVPEKYRLLLNDELKHFADYDKSTQTLLHGKSGKSKITPITGDLQDMASLAFHVAVSYEGMGERQLMVTTGSSVYQITLKPISQDTLKLPGGQLDTVHLRGERLRTDGHLQTGYDIWIAPSLLNFPVKFRGPDSKGNILEMSLLSASFDGQPVFGKDAEFEPVETEPSWDALPAEVRAHATELPKEIQEPINHIIE